MSIIILIIDGAGRDEYKVCSNIKKAQKIYYNNHTPENCTTDSLSCVMSLFGYPKDFIPSGRAYLEAYAKGISVDDTDLVMRLNSVDIENGILTSSCSEKENTVNENKREYNIYNMGAYKNTLIIKNASQFCEGITTYPPHENIGKNINELKIKCTDEKTEALLNSFYEKNLWPWGQSVKQEIPSFMSIRSETAAVVCSTEIVAGLAKACEMYCPEIAGTTADTDTDLNQKYTIAQSLIGKYDYVFIHINGADEAAHRHNQEEKLSFIKQIDEKVTRNLLNDLKDEDILIVTSDHYTDSVTGSHINEKVPVYVFKKSLNNA